MGLKEFATVPQDVREWGRWMRAQLGGGSVPVDAIINFDQSARDAVGAAVADTSTIDITYTSATPELKADVRTDSIDNTLLANMAAATIKGSVAGGDPADLSAAQVASIVSAAVASALNITTGTYTPTLTAVANVSASTAFLAQYFRVGNTVTVSGALLVDPTTTATNSELGISLPIASNFANNFECGGTASCLAVAGRAAGIIADPTNDRARMVWLADDVTNHGRSFLFMYQVI